jgi:hypothetical protein
MIDSPSSYNASGIWSLNDVEEAVQGDNWANPFPVIKDGLQLYLDAGNASSYPGSGNIWYDLSGKNRNFALTNTPFTSGSIPYFSTLGGIMTGPSSNSFEINDRDGYTIYLIMYQNSLVNTGAFKFYGSGTNSRGIFAHATWSDGNVYWDQGGVGGSDTRTFVSAGATDSWNIFVFRRNGYRQRQIIKNNSILITNTTLAADVNLSSINMNLGSTDEYGGSSSTWNARIGHFIVYNRGLSNTELLYNHNSLRIRYGI